MSALPKGGPQHALPTTDIDPVETREWLESLEAVIRDCGPERGLFLLGKSKERARDRAIKPSDAQAEWTAPFLWASEAVQEAKRLSALADKPVVIADTQDNPGGGGESDTTGMLRALLDCSVQDAAIGLMVGAAAAQAKHSTGVGNQIHIELGGESEIVGDSPFRGKFRIEQLGPDNSRKLGLRHSAAVSGASHYRLANNGRGLRASPP